MNASVFDQVVITGVFVKDDDAATASTVPPPADEPTVLRERLETAEALLREWVDDEELMVGWDGTLARSRAFLGLPPKV